MLDARALMLQGGDNGPALVPGDPAKSLLIKSITHEDANLKCRAARRSCPARTSRC